MACDAIARLYDVDEDSAVFKKLDRTEKYDQGTFTFRARQGRLIDLDKLHESVWATRLSGGTRSGLVSLEVTVVGNIVASKHKTILRVDGSAAEFVLAPHPDGEKLGDDEFPAVKKIPGKRLVKLTGVINNYSGRWPGLLAKIPKKPRTILVTKFELTKPR